MNRLRTYTIISLLAWATCLMACWYPSPTPSDNMIYRLQEDVSPYYNYETSVYSRQQPADLFDNHKENIRLWREQTRCNLSEKRLQQIVYEETIEQLRKEKTVLCKELGKDGYYVLMMAKVCEKTREYVSDPWYYPKKNDPQIKIMNSYLKKAEKYHGKLLNRYALQVIRTLLATNRNEEAITYWENVRGNLKDDMVAQMAERRVAAAYLNLGKTDIAKSMYARIGDIVSLRMCCAQPNEEWTIIYKEAPNSPFFPVELQNMLCHIDNCSYTTGKNYYGWSNIDDERQTVHAIVDIAKKAIHDKRIKDHAMWYYSLAAFLDADGKRPQALKYAIEGERHCVKGSFLANSMRILRIYIESETQPLNETYLSHLYNDLKWMDRNGKNSITPSLRKSLETQPHTASIYFGEINYHNRLYWSDALNRILCDVIAPRMKKQNRICEALLFANMGEFWLMKNATGTTHTENNDMNFSTTDYTNIMATMADSCSASEIAMVYQHLTHPSTPMEQLIASNGNTRKGYWCDMIGTHYIKEHKYSKAVKWLSNCSHADQKLVSTWYYFDRDPFCKKIAWYDTNRHHLDNKFDYKLNYARQMVHLEYEMRHGKTADKRGEAMIKYGVGLRNQSDWAWALSRNYDISYDHDSLINLTTSKRYIDKGLATIRDKELKAYYLHAFALNKRVMDECGGTKIAQYLKSHCDLWRDYKKNV